MAAARRTPLALAGLLFLLALSSVVHAATIRVPADQPTIQAGIDAALAGDIVLVAPGVYTGPGNRDVEFRGRNIVVRSDAGPGNTIIDCEQLGRAFYLYNRETNATKIEGLTIRNGSAQQGAAILCGLTAYPYTSGSPTISNCVFEHNTSVVGAIYCPGGAPILTECRFDENSATSHGGAVYCYYSQVSIMDCTFTNNQAASEGALSLYYSNALVERSTFTDNSSTTGGGGVIGVAESHPSFWQCTFSENTAAAYGGVASVGGYGFPIFDHCTFTRNSAGFGGVIVITTITPVAAATLTNCTFSQNSANTDGGCFISYNFEASSFTNCTFYGNNAPRGSAVFQPGNVAPVLRNCIVAFGTGGAAVTGASLGCTDIFGNAGGDWVGSIGGQLGQNGNFSADPIFRDPQNGDFVLLPNSPCLPGNHPNGDPCGQIGVLFDVTEFPGSCYFERSRPGALDASCAFSAPPGQLIGTARVHYVASQPGHCAPVRADILVNGQVVGDTGWVPSQGQSIEYDVTGIVAGSSAASVWLRNPVCQGGVGCCPPDGQLTSWGGDIYLTGTLIQDVCLRGTVRDEHNGAPIANAEVTLSGPLTRPSVTTGPDGRYEFCGLPAGNSYSVSAQRADGFYSDRTEGGIRLPHAGDVEVKMESKVVILVHGICGEASGWSQEVWGMPLTSQGYKVFAVDLTSNDASFWDLAAYELTPYIDDLMTNYNFASCQIVAHSMGCLVSRAYVARQPGMNRVSQLVMLAPPNHGSALAEYAELFPGHARRWFADLLGCDQEDPNVEFLIPGSWQLDRLNHGVTREGYESDCDPAHGEIRRPGDQTVYWSVAATCREIGFDKIFDCPNDRVVTFESTRIDPAIWCEASNNEWECNVHHLPLPGLLLRYGGDEVLDCTAITRSECIRDKVLAIIDGDPGNDPEGCEPPVFRPGGDEERELARSQVLPNRSLIFSSVFDIEPAEAHVDSVWLSAGIRAVFGVLGLDHPQEFFLTNLDFHRSTFR